MATSTGNRAGSVLGGRYELGPVIGRGGMGHVHRAHDARLHRDVAVKVLRLDLSAPGDRIRFEREAMVAARVSHPNVVAVYDVGEQADELYIVMECLPGRTLADELASGPLPAERARRIAVELLGALEAAHAQGVLHRDLKPGNVLFTGDGVAKLGDFGIAKLRDESDLTEAGLVIGTARYLAPERLRGEPATEATDIYAMGVLLYEAVTGCPPFAGDSPAAVAHAVATTEPLPVHVLRPQCDAQLAAAIQRAMAKDPAARFPTAGAMMTAIAGGAGAAVAPAPAAAPADVATATMAPTTTAPRDGAAAASAPLAPTAVAPTVAVGPTAVGPTAVAADPTAVAVGPTAVAPAAADVAPAVAAPSIAPRRSARPPRALVLLGLVLLLALAGLLALAAARSRDETPVAPPTTTATDPAPTSTAPPVPASSSTTIAPAPPSSPTPPPTAAAPAPAAGKGKGKDKKG